MENKLLTSRTAFDAMKIAPGAVIRVTGKDYPITRNNYAWNALVIKVEPFNILVAKLPTQRSGTPNSDEAVEKQHINIDSVVNGNTQIELLRAP